MAKEGFRGRQGTDLKGCVVHGFYSEFNGKSLLLSRNDIIQFTLFCIDSREREEGRERERDLLFHLLMHSSVDSCICPDGGLNPQLWLIRISL